MKMITKPLKEIH